MTRSNSLLFTLLCVALIAIGQVLFKIAATRSQAAVDVPALERWVNLPLLAALTIYCVATLLWIWVLRYVSLNVAYPLFALAFILVPVLAYFLLDEPLSIRHFIGGALIILGVGISTRA
jgi:undecaprenyl phosphate-alpha-L-ara4N flippase subunit ArnE